MKTQRRARVLAWPPAAVPTLNGTQPPRPVPDSGGAQQPMPAIATTVAATNGTGTPNRGQSQALNSYRCWTIWATRWWLM